jgi:hypothetical protein
MRATLTTLLVSLCRSAAWVPTGAPKYSRSAFQRSLSPYMRNSLLPGHSHQSVLAHSSRARLSLIQHAPTNRHLSVSSASGDGNDATPSFQVGDQIQVEVISFGPLGASVSVVGIGHGGDVNLLPVDAEPYATGLIVQQEIAYFRQSRDNVDVVRGEVLPAFVEKVRCVKSRFAVQ